MNPALSSTDFFALTPLLILLCGGLLQLLLESFFPTLARVIAFPLAIATLVSALIVQWFAPTSHNPLLSDWISFTPFSKSFSLLFLSIGIGAVFLVKTFFNRFEAPHGEFYFFLISSVIGLILIASSADFLTLFIGIETLSIPLYVLCGYMKSWELSHESSLKYFLMGALASAFLLYGIALIYGAVGTTQFQHLLAHFKDIGPEAQKVLFLTGIALVTLGLSFKAALVPFHVWAPDVYEGAPTPVTAFMSVGTKAGAFAAFAKLFLETLPHFDPLWSGAMEIIAIATLIYANFVALRQTELKRFFAYSGISHAGYLLFPVIAGTQESLPALQFYLLVYVLATFGCFAVISAIKNVGDRKEIADLKGLYSQSPFLACVFAFCVLTLAGIPPTAGFLAKLAIFKTAFAAGYISLAVIGLLVTILSAYYYLRMIGYVFSAPEDTKELLPLRSQFPSLLVGAFSIICLLMLSLFPGSVTAIPAKKMNLTNKGTELSLSIFKTS